MSISSIPTGSDTIAEFTKTLDRTISFMRDWKERSERNSKRLDVLEAEIGKPVFAAGYERAAHDPVSDLVKALTENRDDFERVGRLRLQIPSLLEHKSVILSAGLIAPSPEAGVGASGRFPYRVRGLMQSLPIDSGASFILRENALTLATSPQSAEGEEKEESTATFTGATIPIETIATFCNVSKQAMDDVSGLSQFLRNTLMWSLERAVESELLTGSGISPHLVGLFTYATAFSASLVSGVTSANAADYLNAGCAQLAIAGYSPNACVINPRDWLKIELLKAATTNTYLIGDPRSSLPQSLWSKAIIVSDVMPQNRFLCGDFSQAHIRQRQQATIDVSYETGENFRKNLVTLRAEERLALVTTRPDAFVYGTLP